MTTDPLLAAYDDQLRQEGEVGTAEDVVHHGPLLWAVFDHGGFVTYRDLGGLRGDALDSLIEETIAHYRDDTSVSTFEWKSRGHDLPADLGDRLVAHGFEAEPQETVMIGEATLLAVDVPLADGVVVDLPRPGGGPREVGRRPRGEVHQLRLHRHVAPDPRALRPPRRDHHDAVRLDPLSVGSPPGPSSGFPASAVKPEHRVACTPREARDSPAMSRTRPRDRAAEDVRGVVRITPRTRALPGTSRAAMR